MLGLSDSSNSEFVNKYNLRCTVDLSANEVVATEIDQEESDSGEMIYQEIYFHVMATHNVLTTLITAVSMKL